MNQDVFKMNKAQRMAFYESQQNRDSIITAKVQEQVRQQPKTKNEKDLQHWLERREQQNRDPMRRSPCTTYDHYIREAEQRIQEERRLADFQSSEQCETALNIFDAKLDSLRIHMSPEQLQQMKVNRGVFIQSATGDTSTLYSELASIETGIEQQLQSRRDELTRKSLEAETAAANANLELKQVPTIGVPTDTSTANEN